MVERSKAAAGISKPGASGVILASGTVALSTLLITMFAGKMLVVDGDARGYQEFVVFWSFLFGVYGIVVGLQNETTRAVGSALRNPQARGIRVLPAGLFLGGCVAVACALLSWWWGPRLVPATMPGIVAAIGLGIVAYAGYMTMLGAAAGYQRWHVFSGLMMIDALGRMALIGLGVLFGLGLLGFELGTIAVSLLWLALPLLVRRAREPFTARGDVGWGPALRKYGFAMISSTSTAILVVGFPVLIQLTGPGEDPGIMSGTITAISLTRSPLMIPLLAFQGVAISAFLDTGERTLVALGKVSGVIALAGVVCAIPAGLFGPWFLRVFYDPAIRADGLTFAGLMLAAVPLAVLTVTGTAVLALDRHRAFSLGWVVAALVAYALLYLPAALPLRVCIALFAGPLVGIAVHVANIARGRVASPAR